MAVRVSCSLRRRRVRPHAVRIVVDGILHALRRSSVELAVSLVGDGAMRRLNRQYRGKDRTTDVLAFASQEAVQPPSRMLVLGDVVVSVPQAERQASAGGHSVDHEIVLLLVHGVLHLCGYDHERSPREALRMARKERALLTKMGRIPRLLAEPRSSRSPHGLV